MSKRSCGTCTACCDGWLTGDIKGHEMYPGKPCFFVSQGIGCNDYEGRPENPCKTFECEWLRSEEYIPEWMKPSECGAIVTWNEVEGIMYLRVKETGVTLSSNVLSQMIGIAIPKQMNIYWEIDMQPNFLGTEEFKQAMLRHLGIKND